MSRTKARKVIYAPLALMGIVFLGAATVPEPVSNDTVAHRWAETHTSELPRHLSGFAAYSVAERRAILHNLTMRERQVLWTEQMEAYLSTRETRTTVQQEMFNALDHELNDAQRAFVAAMLADLPRLFSPEKDLIQRRIAARVWCDSAKKVLGLRGASLVLTILGPPPSPSTVQSEGRAAKLHSASIVGGITAALRVVSVKLGLSPAFANCTCAASSGCDCTGLGMYCVQSQPPCTVTNNCCGCFGLFSCTGNCDLVS